MQPKLKRAWFRKLSNNENAVRTKEMEGRFANPPTRGERFVIFGESLTPEGQLRMINTSPVVEIQTTPTGWIFQTLNSKYEVMLIKEA